MGEKISELVVTVQADTKHVEKKLHAVKRAIDQLLYELALIDKEGEHED